MFIFRESYDLPVLKNYIYIKNKIKFSLKWYECLINSAFNSNVKNLE